MLFVKRLLTALLVFTTIFLVIYVTVLGLGKHQAQTQAVAEVPPNLRVFHHERAVAKQAGHAFEQQYKSIIGLTALGVAAATAIWLSFGGVLSWCRETKFAPLPGNLRQGNVADPYRQDYRDRRRG